MKEWNVPLGATEDRPAVDGTRDHRLLGGRRCVPSFSAADRGRSPVDVLTKAPTANGTPGVHHVEARVFKDQHPRYRTMKLGYHVPRKAGWDCHGLPVGLQWNENWASTASPTSRGLRHR